MTETTPLTRTALFHSRPGQGGHLAEHLLTAASLLGEAPGCELWLVHQDHGDPDSIRVTEMWSSRERCDAALEMPGVTERVMSVMALLDRDPEVLEGSPLGSARMLRGLTGATKFAILDAPDLSQNTGLLDRYDLEEVSSARYVCEQLGATQTGLTHYQIAPGRRQGFAHRHSVAEEIYVALSGAGRIKVDTELFELVPLDAVRVAPASVRELEAGPDGLEVLPFGTNFPGDGEMAADWWDN